MNAAGIGGREGMKPTCGITAAERKARRGKEGKVATPFPSNPSRMLSLWVFFREVTNLCLSLTALFARLPFLPAVYLGKGRWCSGIKAWSVEFSHQPMYWFMFLWCRRCKGGYDKEEKAARAYDLAALKYWGPATHTNLPVSGSHSLHRYIFFDPLWLLVAAEHLREGAGRDEEHESTRVCGQFTKVLFLAQACWFSAHMSSLARSLLLSLSHVFFCFRKSSGFSRGASVYRGVTRSCQTQL